MKLKRYVNGAWVVVDKEFKQLTTATDSAASPITITAPLAEPFGNYRVYGTTSGVGDETENLIEYLNVTRSIYGVTVKVDSNGISVKGKATASGGRAQYLTKTLTLPAGTYTYSVYYIGDRKQATTWLQNAQTIKTISAGGVITLNEETNVFVGVNVTEDDEYDFEIKVSITPGSTAPASYIPPGYKIPLTVTSGETENKANPDNVEIIALNNKYGVKITGAGTWQVKAFDNVYDYVYARVYNSNNEWVSDVVYIVGSTGTMYSRTLTLNEGDTLCIFDPLGTGTEQTAKDKIIEDKIVAIKSDTAPDHYIPHRYTTTTPLYIGSYKLYEEEFLDYQEQKIYKDVSGTLTPTDPPVPFPSVQHYEGESTTSVDTTVAPDKLELTYQGWRVAANPEPKFYHNGQWMTEYRRVEYLKSTGTQAITTNIVPLSTTRTELDIKFGSDIKGSSASGYERGIFGAAEVDGSNNVKAQYIVNALKGSPNSLIFYNKFTWHSGISANYLNNPDSFDTADNAKQTVAMQGGIGSLGSTSIDFTSEMLDWPELTIPLVVFGAYNAAGGGLLPFKVKELSVYEMRIYDNNILTHTLVPVERQIDGALGLYDTITDTFYTNAGTGTFVKGGYI